MLSHDEAMAICEEVLRQAGGDADVTLSVASHALLRIGESQPIQHGHNDRAGLQLRLRLDGRYGEASVDGFSAEEIAKLVADARRQAELLPPARGILESVGPQDLLAVIAHHADSTPETFDAERRGEAAEALTAAARRQGLQAAGIVGVGESLAAKATTGGMRGSYASTSVDLSVTVHADDSSGWRSAWSRSAAAIDPARLGDEAAEMALRARSPQPLEPGTYRAVLAPAAVATILGYVSGGFNARSVTEQRSYLTGKVGEDLFGGRVEIETNPAHPSLQDCPFDGDGWALRRVRLVEAGVAARLLHDRKTAADAGCEATGWSPGGRLVAGAFASSVCMAGGDLDEEALIAACGDGIYITRLWYTNWLDESACSITGMTRDGTFRIRDGKLAEPLTNARIAQPLPALLSGIEALGRPVVHSGSVVPALLVGGLSFSSGTSF